MLSFPSAVRIYLCSEPADMRRSFDRLAVMVRDIIHADPLSGHVFVFRSRRGDRIKLLYWDRDGFALWYKRLEKGLFSWPTNISTTNQLDHRELSMMLEGVDISNIRFKRRFRLKNLQSL